MADFSLYTPKQLQQILQQGGSGAQSDAAAELKRRGLAVPSYNPHVPSYGLHGGVPPEGRTNGTPAGSSAGTPSGLSKGEQEDYYNLVKHTLDSMGIPEATAISLGFIGGSWDAPSGYVARMAAIKADASGIRDTLANDQRVVNINPGAPFGMSKQQYEQAIGRYSAAEQATFGKGVSQPAALPSSFAARNSSVLGYALKTGMDPQEYAGQLERFRQERGRMPTQQEFMERSQRPDTKIPSRYGRPQFQAPEPQPSEQPPQQQPRPGILPSAGPASSVRPAARGG